MRLEKLSNFAKQCSSSHLCQRCELWLLCVLTYACLLFWLLCYSEIPVVSLCSPEY